MAGTSKGLKDFFNAERTLDDRYAIVLVGLVRRDG